MKGPTDFLMLLSLPFVFSRWVVQPSVLVLLLWWFLSFLLWLPFQHIYSQIPSSNYIHIFPLPWKLLHWLIRSVTNTWWNMIKFIGHEVFWNEFRLQRGFLRGVLPIQTVTLLPMPSCSATATARKNSISRAMMEEQGLPFEHCVHFVNEQKLSNWVNWEKYHVWNTSCFEKWSKTGCCRTLSYQSIWKFVSFCKMNLDHLWSVGLSLHASHLLICATGSPRLMDDEAQPNVSMHAMRQKYTGRI